MANDSEIYLKSRQRLQEAGGFYFQHYFEGNYGLGKYQLEGMTVAWDRSHFRAMDEAGSVSEWMIFLQKGDNYKNLRSIGQPKLIFKSYKLKEFGWQLEKEDQAVYGAQEVITLEILGNSHRASRDVKYNFNQTIDGKDCNCYEWSVDAGGHFALWVDTKNFDIVKVEQIQPWGKIETLISKIGQAVTIQEP